MQGHTGIERNEKGDQAVKEAAGKAGTRRCPEQSVSYSDVGHTITKRKWKETKQ